MIATKQQWRGPPSGNEIHILSLLSSLLGKLHEPGFWTCLLRVVVARIRRLCESPQYLLVILQDQAEIRGDDESAQQLRAEKCPKSWLVKLILVTGHSTGGEWTVSANLRNVPQNFHKNRAEDFRSSMDNNNTI